MWQIRCSAAAAAAAAAWVRVGCPVPGRAAHGRGLHPRSPPLSLSLSLSLSSLFFHFFCEKEKGDGDGLGLHPLSHPPPHPLFFSFPPLFFSLFLALCARACPRQGGVLGVGGGQAAAAAAQDRPPRAGAAGAPQTMAWPCAHQPWHGRPRDGPGRHDDGRLCAAPAGRPPPLSSADRPPLLTPRLTDKTIPGRGMVCRSAAQRAVTRFPAGPAEHGTARAGHMP